jgi:hypothetical protein
MQRTTKTNSTRTYSIILLLSLVRHLVGELDHPDPGAKLKELEGLGEQIRKLVLGVDVARLDAPFLQAASDEVVPHPDVLAPFMKNGVLCQGQSGLAVHPEFHRSSVSAEEITKQSNKPERLSQSGGGHYVLGLATTYCLTDCQLTRHLPKKKRIPLVLLLVSMSSAWSLSLYLTRCASPGHLG